jgi:hypothetical protein
MTLQGIVARPHSVVGFANPSDFYTSAAPIAPSGAPFSAWVEITIASVETPAADQRIAGNLDATGGWAIGRSSTGPCVFKFSVLGLDLLVPIDPAVALDQTFMLGMSADGVMVQATVNGVILATGLSASPSSTGVFGIGGDPGGVDVPTEDLLIFCQYDTAAYNASGWYVAWREARRYSTPAPKEYTWRALVLYPADGSVPAPATWVNTGIGAGGNLAYGGAGNLFFQDDPFGSFTGAVAPAIPAPMPLLTPLDIFVVPAPLGNDANDGLTPLTPVETMAGAYSKIPTSILGAAVRIHTAAFLGPNLVWSPIPDFVSINDEGQIIILGDGAGQPGEDGFSPVAPANVAGATTTNAIVDCTALAPAPDSLLGFTIRFTTGVAIGQLRTVRNNTATEIIPCANFDVGLAPAPGDLFDILAPATFIDITAANELVCAGSGSCFPTIINLGVLGGGAGNRFIVANVPCLKMFGCFFALEAHFSARDSNVYAGVTETANPAALYAADIHLPQLWTALGGVQNWVGWGLSSTDHLTILQPLTNFNGYIACVGALVVFAESSDDRNKLAMFGGYCGGFFGTSVDLVVDSNNPNGVSSWLCRDTETPECIALGQSDALFVSSPSLENTNTLGVSTLVRLFLTNALWADSTTFATTLPVRQAIEAVQSIVNFAGGLTLTVQDTDAAGALYVSAGEFSVAGAFVLNAQGTGRGCVFVNGAETLFEDALTVNITGPSQTSAFLVTSGSALRCTPNTGLPTQPLTITTTTPGNYSGILIDGAAEVLLDLTNVTMDDPDTGISCLRGSTLFGPILQLNNVTTLGLDLYGSNATRFADIDITGFAGTVCVLQGNLLVEGTYTSTTVGPGLFAIQDSSVVLGSLIATSTGLGGFGVYVGLSARLNVVNAGSVSADGVAVNVTDNAQVNFEQLDITSATDDALRCFSESRVSILGGSPSTFTAGANGINCTGGGRCSFVDATTPPTFAVGGFELVVGPGILEQSTFAAALPNPGDSYSNAGAGSTITRNN